MVYKIVVKKKIEKKLKKFGKDLERRMLDYLELRVALNPYNYGKSLSGNLSNYWRYRVGNYRIICKIKDEELIILIIEINHRSTIYKFLTK